MQNEQKEAESEYDLQVERLKELEKSEQELVKAREEAKQAQHQAEKAVKDAQARIEHMTERVRLSSVVVFTCDIMLMRVLVADEKGQAVRSVAI